MQFLPMDKTIRKGVLEYLDKNFGDQKSTIIKKADETYPELLKKAPDIGGKKNWMSCHKKVVSD